MALAGRVETDRRFQTTTERSIRMSDKHVDEGKGRLKEAAGSLTDDDSLKTEGKIDKAKSSAKDAVDKVTDKAKDAVDKDD